MGNTPSRHPLPPKTQRLTFILMPALSKFLIVLSTLFATAGAWYILHLMRAASFTPAHRYDLDTGSLFGDSLVQNTKLVQMVVDNTVHYRPGWPTAEEEFDRLLPSGGHLIFDDDKERNSQTVYTIAMFHQLKCLGVLQADYTSRVPSRLRKHCLNYLRQSVLCLADRCLESVRSPLAPNLVDIPLLNVCNDWMAVYRRVEESWVKPHNRLR